MCASPSDNKEAQIKTLQVVSSDFTRNKANTQAFSKKLASSKTYQELCETDKNVGSAFYQEKNRTTLLDKPLFLPAPPAQPRPPPISFYIFPLNLQPEKRSTKVASVNGRPLVLKIKVCSSAVNLTTF